MSISVEIARRIMEACKQRAQELRSPVSIAIVDAGGHLVLFERMMAPYGWATGNISLAKASTAVMFNQSTDAVAQWGSGIPGFASSMASMTQGKFIMAAGGWPIRMGGTTIGGIGVSGGNAPGRDDDIARAGLAAIALRFPAITHHNNRRYNRRQLIHRCHRRPLHQRPRPASLQCRKRRIACILETSASRHLMTNSCPLKITTNPMEVSYEPGTKHRHPASAGQAS